MGFIYADDLAPFAEIAPEKALAMIEDATAQAILAAPCLAGSELSEHQVSAVKSILRGAILRWNETGVAGVSQIQDVMGPFAQNQSFHSPGRRTLFWPSEVEQLQSICNAISGGTGGAFSLNTAPCADTVHALVCSINFGADHCSCGADIAGIPIFEVDE